MTIYEKYQKLKTEYQIKEIEIGLWYLLTELNEKDIATLSQEDQYWRTHYINVRKDKYFFQQLTKIRDPNYEQPSLIKDGFFHPDIAKQLSIPPLPKGAVSVWECGLCKKGILRENYTNHILEHHPNTEVAERLRSKKTKK